MQTGPEPDVEQKADLRYGLPALFEELVTQGISESDLMEHASLLGLEGPKLNYQERLALFRSAFTLCTKPETGLQAGRRQTIAYFGAYGYVLATSATLGEAIRIAASYIGLSGSVLRISQVVEDDVGIWQSHEPETLGQILPFVAEYWRSSQATLFSQILGKQFPSISMSFPYPPPKHKHLYSEIFNCPVNFGSEKMEWRFDASVLDEPCANADPGVANLRERYCEQFLMQSGSKSVLQRELQRACIENLSSKSLNAPTIAAALNMSVRTFYRKLSNEGISFQNLVDNVLQSIAIEYLTNTNLTVEQIANRCNYQDSSNFRKAFYRWTGRTPSSFRSRIETKTSG